MSDDFIHVQGVVKRYGALTALHNVTLWVKKGEFVALLGPSGCGKTTLLRLLAGFDVPDEGEVWIDKQPMHHQPPDKRPVNTVFQNYALFPHYTVAENIAFGPRRQGRPRAEIPSLVDEALKTVGMQEFGGRYPAQLSGGQQQRVALARAIINRPKVLLLDEPLSALDLKLRKQMQMELKRLHEQLGITFIYVTHDQEEALVLADRIAVMTAGQIVQFADGKTIYHAPNSRYVADFIGEANLLPCIVDQSGAVRLENEQIILPNRVSDAANIRATLLIRPEKIAILDRPAKPGETVLDVSVVNQIFTGSNMKLFVRSAKGSELLLQTSGQTHHFKAGDAARVAWQSSDATILTR